MLPGTVVSGRFGPLTFSNPNARRRSHSRIIGRIVVAVGSHEYRVQFVDGTERVCKSCRLRVVRTQDIPPTLRDTYEDNGDVEENSTVSSSGTNPNVNDDNNGDIQEPNPTVQSDTAEVNEDSRETVHVDEGETQPNLGANGTNVNVNNVQTNVPDVAAVPALAQLPARIPAPGRAPVPPPVKLSHEDRIKLRRSELLQLTGDTVEMKSNNQSIIWTVVEEHIHDETERVKVGLTRDVLTAVTIDPKMTAYEIFIRLMYDADLISVVVALNQAVQIYNDQEDSRRPIRMFTVPEFLKCNAMLIAAVCFSASGRALWKTFSDMVDDDWITVEPAADFGQWGIKFYRFKEFRHFFPEVFQDVSRSSTDPWWKFVKGIEDFNRNRSRYLIPTNHLTMDELMSAWCPQTTKTGGLPNITNIPRKPEPLGTELKCVTCTKTNVMLFLELQRGREGMRDAEYHRELGATSACTVRLGEEW